MPSVHQRGDCRVCGKDRALTDDEVVIVHGPARNRCRGSGWPPKGELPCGPWCGRMGGTVSYPPDLMTMPVEQLMAMSHASTYVCRDPQHQAEAAEWVRATTGHTGVFVPFGVVADA